MSIAVRGPLSPVQLDPGWALSDEARGSAFTVSVFWETREHFRHVVDQH